MNFEGVYSVLPTPFQQDADQIDWDSLHRVIDLFLRAGVDGFTALGVTSEVARLTTSEKRELLDNILSYVNGRVPVVAGTTAEGSYVCMETSRAAISAGASAVMVSPPRMPKLNSEAILTHYRRLAEAVTCPIVVQDYPPVSGYTMEPTLLVRISVEIPSARTIKLEDAPTPLKISRIRKEAGQTPIAIFGGLGGMYLLEELLSGANGAMTGFAYPEILVEIVRSFFAEDRSKAASIFYRYVALMRFEFQEGIGMAIRKEMLRRRGALKNAVVRPPGAALDASTSSALDHMMHWLKQDSDSNPSSFKLWD